MLGGREQQRGCGQGGRAHVLKAGSGALRCALGGARHGSRADAGAALQLKEAGQRSRQSVVGSAEGRRKRRGEGRHGG